MWKYQRLWLAIYSWLPAEAVSLKKSEFAVLWSWAMTAPAVATPHAAFPGSLSFVKQHICALLLPPGLQLHCCFQARRNKHLLEIPPLMSMILIEVQARLLSRFGSAQLYFFLLKCGNTLVNAAILLRAPSVGFGGLWPVSLHHSADVFVFAVSTPSSSKRVATSSGSPLRWSRRWPLSRTWWTLRTVRFAI